MGKLLGELGDAPKIMDKVLGELGDAPKIMGKARPFHDIKVWGGRFNKYKNIHVHYLGHTITSEDYVKVRGLKV